MKWVVVALGLLIVIMATIAYRLLTSISVEAQSWRDLEEVQIV